MTSHPPTPPNSTAPEGDTREPRGSERRPPGAQEPAPRGPATSTARLLAPSRLYWNVRTLLAWTLCLSVFLYFAVTNPLFLNDGNLYAFAQIFAPLAIVSAGLALVMIAAEFDLSIAGTFPLAGLIAVRWGDSLGWTWSVGLAVVVGVGFGILNGLLTAVLRIPSLAVTVATMVLAIGIGYAVTNNDLVNMTDFDASARLTARLAGFFSLMAIVQLGLAVLVYLYVRTSWQGRYVYAVGSDAARARNSGLPVIATLTFVFVVSAAFASLAGALQGISLATGQAGANDTFLLQCATAALLGGVALTGGRGSLAGVIGGACLLALLNNGLGLSGLESPEIQLVNGVVLAAVVLVDRPLARLVDGRISRQLPPSDTPHRVTPGAGSGSSQERPKEPPEVTSSSGTTTQEG